MPTVQTCKGLVLRETPLGEADKLFDLFTAEGILTVRARSVRRPGSKYAAVTQLFSYGEFCLRESAGRYYLDSAVPLQMFYGLRSELDALALASYFAEAVRRTAAGGQQPQIMRLLLHCLYRLSEKDREPELIKSIFELRLASLLGFAPNLLCCRECGEFLPETPVFCIPERDLVCAECLPPPPAPDENAPFFPENAPCTATIPALQAARHILFAEEKRLFQFRLTGRSVQALSQYTERYLCACTEMKFPTLDFYHTICNTG